MSKVVKMGTGRGRTGKLQFQKIQEKHGNMSKKKKVAISGDRKYKKTPPPPRHLSPYAKSYWRDHAPEYVRTNRLNRGTREPFEVLASAWGRWKDWQEMILELTADDPLMRGLIYQDGETVTTKPNGSIVKKGGVVKISIPADRVEKAEAHFYSLLIKFLDVSSQFEESKSESRWPD